MRELTQDCVVFHTNSVLKRDSANRRAQLSKWIRKFHSECGTLTSDVKEAIDKLNDSSCIVIMTAHQPNLFAYGGVMRKATLGYALSRILSKELGLPVISFFGIADQDFANDRWLRSALLPDVQKRDGILELRYDINQKLMLTNIPKPSVKTVDNWKNEIRRWLLSKINSVKRLGKELNIEIDINEMNLISNSDGFLGLINECYDKSRNYPDFNAFLMSRIINEVWGYDTLFSRFSECQQIFEEEFKLLISNFREYSTYVREATDSNEVKVDQGVSELEYQLLPFWYHCECGSKVRLTPEFADNSLSGVGECDNCKREYLIKLLLNEGCGLSNIISKISARALAMPLVFFLGLGVCCYIGGAGGQSYLRQAKHVADHMNILFPPIAVWRPRDRYHGISQVEALLIYQKISGNYDSSLYTQTVEKIKKEIYEIRKETKEIESRRQEFISPHLDRDAKSDKISEIINVKKYGPNRDDRLPNLLINERLLENISHTLTLYPCIIDYAINTSLQNTSKQWIGFLTEDGTLNSDLYLETNIRTSLPLNYTVS